MRDDMEFNVTLCMLVKKYPQLYDYRTGIIRNLKNRIWEEIGRKLNESAYDCKQRWRRIRGRYWDYLAVKNRQSTSPIGKRFLLTYYLASHLEFLDQYMLPRRFKAPRRAIQASTVIHPNKSPKISENKEILKSAIPDMKGLSRAQNDKFKFGVINLMERVMQQEKAKELLLESLQE